MKNFLIKIFFVALGVAALTACRLKVDSRPPADVYFRSGHQAGTYFDFRFDVPDGEITGHWGHGEYDLSVDGSTDTVKGWVDDEWISLEIDYHRNRLWGQAYCGSVMVDIDEYSLELYGRICDRQVEGQFASTYDAHQYLEDQLIDLSAEGFPVEVQEEVKDFTAYLID